MMLKRISIILMSVLMILTLCSCDSKEVKQAKEAYAEKDYSTAAELLSKEENLDEETQEMLVISEANVLYENKDYLEAAKRISTSNNGIKAEQFEEFYSAALNVALEDRSAGDLVELAALDESKTDAIFDGVIEICKNKDYDGFKLLDKMIKKLDDGNLKTKFSDFDDEYGTLRAESFMIGKWERRFPDVKTKAVIKVIPYKDGLVGRLVKVGDDQKIYHFHKNDLSWQDIEFESDKKFICTCLVKYEDGGETTEVGTGTINYKKNQIKTKVNGTVNPDLVYKRIK